jgi:RHS repeat-associated protein
VTLNTGAVNNVWGFAGGFTDTTGLVKFETRYYDPSIGRWTQQDPVAGSIANPGSVNRYLYTNNNPTNETDTSGRCNIQYLLEGIDLVALALGAAGVGIVVATLAAPTVIGIPVGIIIILAGAGTLGFAAYEEFAASGCF